MLCSIEGVHNVTQQEAQADVRLLALVADKHSDGIIIVSVTQVLLHLQGKRERVLDLVTVDAQFDVVHHHPLVTAIVLD